MAVSSGTAVVTLPADDQILIKREFDAPKELVFAAWTTPELIKKWWTARRGEITTCEVDLRVGGRWRYAMFATHGFEVAFHGEFREIVPNERIVSTEIYEGAPDAAALSTSCNTAARRTAICMSKMGWRRACRTRWTCLRSCSDRSMRWFRPRTASRARLCRRARSPRCSVNCQLAVRGYRSSCL